MCQVNCTMLMLALSVSYILTMLFPNCNTFNLEPRVPIVKMGQKNTYFGYSVAEHQGLDPLHGVMDNWMLVGAPLGRNLQPNTSHSGALFRCPLTMRLDDCEQVTTDGKKNVDSDGQLFGPLPDEFKDGQWLGVTVKSQGTGGKVLVCAHRYSWKKGDSQWADGFCYILSQNFNLEDMIELCKGRPREMAHEQFGYCQTGTSGLLLKDDTAVIGAPGPYTWRGTIFVKNVSDNFLDRDKTIYMSPLSDDEEPVHKYSYLGMSVTAGTYFGDKMSFATGATRANATGQVFIFSKKQKSTANLTLRLILNGEQIASSFGYEIATANIDGDKKADLIVGAPFYFNREEGGAVYIYRNLSDVCNNCNIPRKLTGKPESRFGFAITNLGDINKDSYDDIAIGAPYDGNGVVYIYLGSKDGIGAEPAQVIKSEDLPISLKTFGYSLSGGLDLDSNGYPDLLIGAYENDSVVLLLSRPIISIESYAKLLHITSINPSKRGCHALPQSEHRCFTYETCVSIKYKKTNDDQSLRLNFQAEAETFNGRKKLSRVWFQNHGNPSRSHILNKLIFLNKDSYKNGHFHQCIEETVLIKENTTDIQSPLQFHLSFTIVQDDPKWKQGPIPIMNNYPILNQKGASIIFEVPFQKDCGSDDVCQSELEVIAMPQLREEEKKGTWPLMLGQDTEFKLNVTVNNKNEPAYEAKLFVSHPAVFSFIVAKSENKFHHCAKLNSTLIVCDLGNPFKRGTPAKLMFRFDASHVSDDETILPFIVYANSTSREENPDDPKKLQIEVIRKADLSIKSVVQPDHVFYGGEVVGESAMKYHDQIGSRVVHMYKIYNEGPWHVGAVEVHVEWPYQVANNKPQGKWLLYLLEPPIVEGSGECIMSNGQVNPLRLEPRPGVDEVPLDALMMPPSFDGNSDEVSSTSSRTKRELEMVIRAEAYTDKDGKRRERVTMSCLLGSAKCFKFRCIVRNLHAKQEAIIKIRARLWNATLVEDYPKVDMVHIISRAKIHFNESPIIKQNNYDDDEASAKTEALPDKLDQQDAEEIPIWIIIVSVVAGLLLLVLLSFLLWKVGFFKRRRPDHTLSGNLEKHPNENGEWQ